MTHHGGDVCELCVLLAKSHPNGSFLFPPEQTWLLSCKILKIITMPSSKKGRKYFSYLGFTRFFLA
jgi:hypothetical protein